MATKIKSGNLSNQAHDDIETRQSARMERASNTGIRNAVRNAAAATITSFDNSITFSGDYIVVPKLDSDAVAALTNISGQVVFNTTLNRLQQNTGNQFVTIDAPPQISNISPTSFNGAAGSQITVNGSNFSVGANVDFISDSGRTIASSSVTRNSENQLVATTAQALTVIGEPYDIKVTNASGLSSILSDALDAGRAPYFVTASGNIGSTFDSYASDSFTITAADSDNQSLNLSIDSASVPAGMNITLSSANDSAQVTIAGSPDSVTASTTSNFVVTATDNAGNTRHRTFNIITNPVLDGTSSARANASALRIIKAVEDAGGDSADWQALEGPLWLNPAKFAGSNSSATPFQVWCDMNTQGGGWTLLIKFDYNQSSRSNTGYGLERTGGRGYNNTSQLYTLDPSGSVKMATIDGRDIISYDRSLTYNSTQFGGRYMMHCATNKTSGVGRIHYTGHNFTASVAGSNVTVDGATTTSFSPIFSQFHKNMYEGTNTSRLWQTDHSSITNSGGTGSTTTYQNYASSSDINTYGGGVFYALGTDRRTAPSNHNSYIDPNAGYDDHSSVQSPNAACRQDVHDGQQMFSCVNREGSVYCAGTNQAGTTGHQSPKFNWGWQSADGTGQTYGMGTWAIGTACSTGAEADTNRPDKRMNYMFIR